MAKKLTKQDIKSPDAFLRTMEQGISFTSKYGKPLAAVVVAAVLIAVGVLIANFIHDRSESSAAQALFKPQNEYRKLHDQFEQAKAPADPKADPKAAKPVAASGDLQKDYGLVVAGFENVIKEHSGTVAASQAAVYLASIYQEYGKLDEAKAAVEKVLKDAPKGTLIFSVAHMVHGNILATQGNCKDAVASYDAVKDFLSVDASVKAGVCYEKLGQLDQAAEMYRKASADAESSTSLAAKGFLKALEQKRQSQPAVSGSTGQAD